MVTTALRPIGHIAAWLVWHSMRVSCWSISSGPVRPPAEPGPTLTLHPI
jgi:hypothetical protein